ncbi:MAG: M28 family peptidase [Planctomycetota bacterium]
MNVVRTLRNGVLAAVLGMILVTVRQAPASEAGLAAADQVSPAGYRDFLDLYLYTHVGDDRGFGPEHNLARANIVDLMESYGLTVTLEPFLYSSITYYNVVGEQLGTTYPDQFYIVGAHFDSVDNPGADDNASGVALVLEAARILSQYPSDYTIRFIAFDREEQGLYGSEAYVAAHGGDDIRGMISADMVAYDPATNHANVYGRTASNPIKTALGQAITEYGDGLTYTIGGDTPYSNHAPFESAGFQACLLIEGEMWSNPYYHTQQDSFEQPGNLNFPYAVKMVRSVVGFLVDHAGVQVAALTITLPEGTPTRVDPEVPTPITVQINNASESYVPGSGLIHYRFDGGAYLTGPLTPLGANLYEALLPAAACGDTPEFYFSALGDGGTTVTNPKDAPAGVYSALVATLTTVLDDDFETDQGWAVENIDLSTGTWQRGIPAGGGTRGDPVNDFDGSGGCYLTDNRPGNSDVDGGPTRLISPTLDVSGVADPVLRYARWFSNDDLDQDRLVVEVSADDGASWTLLESVPDTEGWVERTVHLRDYVALTPQFKVRFSVADNPNNSVTEAAVDAVNVYDLYCFVPGDFDGDGDVDLADYAVFADCMAGPETTPAPAPPATAQDCLNVFDFDVDSDVDLTDFAGFQEGFTG